MLNVIKTGPYAKITCPQNWVGKTIETVLKEELQIPKKMLHQWRMQKNVLLNGDVTSWSTKILVSSIMYIPIYAEDLNLLVPLNLKLEILYEDDDIIVVNKPPFLNTHPISENDHQSLMNAITAYLNNQNIKPRHIHRLDKDTSGAILLAKHAYAGALLDQALSEGKIKRTYAALVHGLVKKEEDTINAPIAKDRHTSGKMRISPSGKQAVTHYKVLDRMKSNRRTLVACKLETGRTHQIRVHMSSIGHPLVGDTLYGGKDDTHLNRQALHAYRLEFIQPITQRKLSVESKIPFI